MLSCVVSEGLGTFKGRADSGKVEDKGVESNSVENRKYQQRLGVVKMCNLMTCLRNSKKHCVEIRVSGKKLRLIK